MQTIQEFIDLYLAIADARNIDTVNPVKLSITDPSINDQEFVLVVSASEPTFAQIPFNVLWILNDPEHSLYKKVFRRVGSTPSGDFKGSWAELSTYDSLFTEAQYYKNVKQDLREHGITSLSSFVGPATVANFGLGYLTSGDQGLGVSENDPRNSDKRYPVSHEHPDYARKLIALNEDQYAVVDQSLSPDPGKVLVLGDRHPENALEFSTVWRHLVFDDLVKIDRRLVSLSIEGSSTVQEQSTAKYRVIAHYADGRAIEVMPSVFMSSNPSVLTITDSGTLTSYNIQEQKTVTISAQFDDEGIYVSADFEVTVTLGLEVTGLRIQGANTVTEENSSVYTFIASFNDGQDKTIIPQSVSVDPVELGSLDITGIFTAGEAVDGNKQVVLNASYYHDGVQVTANKTVSILDITPYPVSLEILGPVRLNERETGTYSTRLTFSDNKVYNFPLDSFEQSSDAFSTFDGTTLEVGQLSENQTVVLIAEYSQFSTQVTGSLTVQLDNLPPTVERIDILSPDSAAASRSGDGTMPLFNLQYLYDDGTTQDVTIDTANSNYGIDILLEASQTWSQGVLTLDSSNTDKAYQINITGLDSLTGTDTFKDTQTAPFDFILEAAKPNILRAWQTILGKEELVPAPSSDSYWALYDIVYFNNAGSRHSFELPENFSESDYLPHTFDLDTADWETLLGGNTFACFIIPPENTYDTRVERSDYNVATGGGNSKLYPGVRFYHAFDSEQVDTSQEFSLTWTMVFVRKTFDTLGSPIYTHVTKEETFSYVP